MTAYDGLPVNPLIRQWLAEEIEIGDWMQGNPVQVQQAVTYRERWQNRIFQAQEQGNYDAANFALLEWTETAEE